MEAANSASVPSLGFDSDAWMSRVARAAIDLELGTLAGYRLVRIVARGSQGTVYEALEPRTDRRVAIKRLPSAQPSHQESARFALETAALSALSHPHIVTLLAAPEEDHSRLLVMEWLDGAHFDKWSDTVWSAHSGKDAVKTVVSCVAKICSAIAAAHALSLVHRDLKPSNVLIDLAGEPKILDFGIAKSLLPDAEHTRTGGFTGTPAWAAPEQVGAVTGLPDARVDVHGLGLLLYRALAGRCAFDPLLPIGPLFTAIESKVPPVPSKIRGRVPRELDTVVLKALEKDPVRRYPTADAMQQDLLRFLRDEPVQAHPPTTAYLFRKFVGRHRALTAALALAACMLVGGTVVSALFAAEATNRAEQAERSTMRATRMNGFFRQLLANLREREQAGERTSARDIVSLAAASLESDPYPPDSEADLRETLGVAYFEIGDYKSASTQYRLALDALARTEPNSPAEQARLLLLLALSQMRALDPASALASARQAVQLCSLSHSDGFQRARSLEVLSMASLNMQQLTESRLAIDESIALARQAADEHQLALSLCSESLLLGAEGNVALAAERAREAVALIREALEATAAERARVLHNAGYLCAASGEHEEALGYLRESHAIREAEYPPGHPSLNVSRSSIALSLRSLGRTDEAVALLERTLREYTASHPTSDIESANLRRHLARAHHARGTHDDARIATAYALAACEEFARCSAIERTQGITALNVLVRSMRTSGDSEGARALLWTLPDRLATLANEPALAGTVRAALASELMSGPKATRLVPDDRLLDALRDDLIRAMRRYPDDSPQVIRVVFALSQALQASASAELADEGRSVARRALPGIERRYGAQSPDARLARSLAGDP